MTRAVIRRPLGSRTVTSVPGAASRASTCARQMHRPRVGDILLEVTRPTMLSFHNEAGFLGHVSRHLPAEPHQLRTGTLGELPCQLGLAYEVVLVELDCPIQPRAESPALARRCPGQR